jgi:SAM-dependent methyltransferase
VLRDLLAHPLTRGRSIDDPATTLIRRRIIGEKRFLRRIYEEWYTAIAAQLPPEPGAVLELGSGAGFLNEYVPDLIRSEVFCCAGIEVVLDGRQLPFASSSLRAIVMTDVMHHIPDVELFFSECARCLRSGGRVVMWEPWVSRWSRFVYRGLHHERFDEDSSGWSFPLTGPLSGANGALPWIVLERDRQRFERLFPQLWLRRIVPAMPFRYLLSGGVSLRSLLPGSWYPVVAGAERLLTPWMHHLAMFAFIVIERTAAPATNA